MPYQLLKPFVSIIILMMVIGFTSNAQEKILINREINWLTSDNFGTNPYGGNSFYWWHRKNDGTHSGSPVNVTDLGEMPSDNWLTPVNYRNGTFYLRFEVIEQPTNTSFDLLMGIWQDKGLNPHHRETVSQRHTLTGGAGTYIEVSLGSPAVWWQHPSAPEPKAVDFARPGDFYRLGVVLWNRSPLCIPMSWNSDVKCVDWSTIQAHFFPMKARLTVVAVAEGATFSGWGNYGGGNVPLSYGIDYLNERTNKIISSEDEYSYHSDFSDSVQGNNQFLSLSPGDTVYLRKRGKPANNQTLIVKQRPAMPNFSIDYPNERTSAAVSNAYEHAATQEMSGAITGSGAPVTLTPGTNRFFRIKATDTTFKSSVQELLVKSRPATPTFTINYPNETTATAVSADVEHANSLAMTGAITGSNTPVAVVPGSNKYFRRKATSNDFASLVQTLVVKARPTAPIFAVNYTHETTTTIVSALFEHADNISMTNKISGTGAVVALVPGTDKYFRRLATATDFSSVVQHLVVKARLAAPNFGIDFINKTTLEPVESTHEYASNATLAGAITGNGSKLSVTPGSTRYFRIKATANDFRSQIQTLAAPSLSPQPTFAIHFPEERTQQVVTDEYSYAYQAGMWEATDGPGTQLLLVPGQDIYFRKKASVEAFESEVQHLRVPVRLFAPNVAINFVEEVTSTNLSTDFEIATNPAFDPKEFGTGMKHPVTPGTDLYIRLKPTSTLFASSARHLLSPLRPLLQIEASGPVTTYPLPVTVNLIDDLSTLTAEGLEISNGSVYTIHNGLIKIVPTSVGTVGVRIKANALFQGNFASEQLQVDFQGIISQLNNIEEPGRVKIFPTLTNGFFYILNDEFVNNLTVTIYDLSGRMVLIKRANEATSKLYVDISPLEKGTYLINVSTGEQIQVHKIIKI